MKIIVVISIIVTTTYRLSTAKLGPNDIHSSVCNQQTLLRALTAYLFTEVQHCEMLCSYV